MQKQVLFTEAVVNDALWDWSRD